ncbi:uncharacterized protein LOC109847926 [Asparagus officinalis]|uniref:uncharacterized protein LOC109847926 n=1 Tax=Asparagus officinalis TaxID=4686 RepID=UPI00098E03C2|nr:uncharacterized protein LOC109847926 [Asparagus officinalis]
MSPRRARGKGIRPTVQSPEEAAPAAPSRGVRFPSTTFTADVITGRSSVTHSYYEGIPLIEFSPQFKSDYNGSDSELIQRGSCRVLRRLITDAPLISEQDSNQCIRKPDFLFGDSVKDPKIAFCQPAQWLHQSGSSFLYLPFIPRDHSLLMFRNLSVGREMFWKLTENHEHIHCGFIGKEATPGSSERAHVRGLHPGVLGQDNIPQNEKIVQANTVKNRLAAAGKRLPRETFRCYGWVHYSGNKWWWTRMTQYVLKRFGRELAGLGLDVPIRATMHGLQSSVSHFLCLFEIYNPDTNTFFTKNGELGLPLHEMMQVSALPMGDVPYQEFFPTTNQLIKMKDSSTATYDTLWELTCHYHIAMAEMEPKARKKSPQVSLKQFADYLFKNLDVRSADVCGLSPLSTDEINRLLEKTNAHSYTSRSEDGFLHGTKFRSYLWQAGVPISPTALLAGFLALWLKRCVVPHQSADAMPMEVLYPAVQLATGRKLSLLPAMVADIHSGLRQLISAFTQEKKKPSASLSVPKLELPYTYLMAWLVLHRPDLMEAPDTVDLSVPLLQNLENCKWSKHREPDITRQFKIHKCWEFFPCFPQFSGTYNTTLVDAEDPRQNRTILDVGCFRWLMNIRPGYLLFRIRDVCHIEPYLPCRFARQFGYDQIYIGNPNRHLSFRGGLIDGARAWFWSIAGCTNVEFDLPLETPPLRMTFLFCKWLIATNIVTRRRRISDSEEEIAPRQAAELPREAVMSPRGKEAAESSRKGKEPARSVGSEEEFDSEETETSEEAGETSSSSDERAGLPDSFFERGLVCPSVAPTQSQATSRKRGERVVMTYPNRMTVDILSGDEEDEEDEVPLARRQRSRPSTQAQTQIPPRTELRTKRRHEGPEAHPPKKQKKAASKPRVHLSAVEDISGRNVSSDELESQEEGEYRVGAASPGGMETEETSFVQQMQDVLKEGPADVPPTPDVDPSAADTGTDLSPLGREIREMNESDRVPPLMTCALSLLLVKLKEAGTSSGALESAPTNEDVTMHESVGGETTHTTEVEEFNEHHLDFNLSEGDHEYISDLLSGKTPGAATESNVGVGPTEAGPSESKTFIL